MKTIHDNVKAKEDLKNKILTILYGMKNHSYIPTQEMKHDFNIIKAELLIMPIVIFELELDGLIEDNSIFTKLTTKGLVYTLERLN